MSKLGLSEVQYHWEKRLKVGRYVASLIARGPFYNKGILDQWPEKDWVLCPPSIAVKVCDTVSKNCWGAWTNKVRPMWLNYGRLLFHVVKVPWYADIKAAF